MIGPRTSKALQAIFLDFDGVVLESTDIKTRAFSEIFLGYPVILRKRIVDYHVRNAGLSRFKKFEYIYRHILKEPLSPAKSRALGEMFSRYVHKKILRCRFVPGAFRFIKEFSRKVDLYIISGTPDAELKGIIRQRGLLKYFKGVYGTPQTKEQSVFQILRRSKIEARSTVFVGDARIDWMTAAKCGVPFIGRVPAGCSSVFPKKSHIIRDLRGLKAILFRIPG